MQVEEINRLFAFLMAAFPMFKPDRAAVALWAAELPDCSATDAIEAVRRLKSDHPSPFPPDVFSLAAQFQAPRVAPEHEAKIAFAFFWHSAAGHRGAPPDNLERAREAWRLATGGQGYGQAQTSEMPFHERRYVDIYCGLAERDTAPALPAASAPALEAPDEVH